MKINGKDYKKVKKMNGAQASVSTSALSAIDIQAVMSLVSKAYEVFYAKKGDMKLADQLKVLLENINMASAIKSLLQEAKDSRFMIVVASCVIEPESGLNFESFEEFEEKRKVIENDLLHADEDEVFSLFTFFLNISIITRNLSQSFTIAEEKEAAKT
ncbi:MAG: hypothetical protein ACRBG0_27740 [Lewinella sp.]|uniref:hypothetical protein n=1 Tax=Lewinella sp. TaxID=2004506 RepID=UPI003D6B8E62